MIRSFVANRVSVIANVSGWRPAAAVRSNFVNTLRVDQNSGNIERQPRDLRRFVQDVNIIEGNRSSCSCVCRDLSRRLLTPHGRAMPSRTVPDLTGHPRIATIIGRTVLPPDAAGASSRCSVIHCRCAMMLCLVQFYAGLLYVMVQYVVSRVGRDLLG